MVYLFSEIEEVERRLSSRPVYLFLDYDGTLTPIADTPDKAVISKEARKMLHELSLARECKLAIVSGRSLKDIMGIIGLKDIIYSGNHGLEIHGPKLEFSSVVAPGFGGMIKKIKADLGKKLARIKGVILEDKGHTLSVHYRMVKQPELPLVMTAFHETTAHYLVNGKIKIKTGKMMLEVRPPINWDKGRSVMWLLARQQFISGERRVLPVYIGDDATDEDAFAALGKRGITVFVGKPGKSRADYYLKDHKDVMKFLNIIRELKRD